MRKMKRRSLGLALLVVGFASWGALALPGFSDRNINAGNLNPADKIKVQEIRVTRSSSETVTLSSITIQNLGTAGDGEIDKIIIEDGGDELGSTTNIAGLATGVTVNLGGFNMTSTTHDLKILVVVGTAVSGGETVNLRCKIHYVRNGLSYSSAWISDLTGETIRLGGFDEIDDSSPEGGYFNPSDADVVQRTIYTDNDANGMPVEWQDDGATTIVEIENLGTADSNPDIAEVRVTLTVAGKEYTWDPSGTPKDAVGDDGWGAWDANPKTFSYNEFWENLGADPAPGGANDNPQEIPDNGTLTVEVEMKVSGDPTDGRTIRTRTTVFVAEQGQDSEDPAVRYEQTSTADAIQTIREQGFERIEEESETLGSGTAATGDQVIQTIRVADDDRNAGHLQTTQIYLRNMGTADADEIDKIVVKSGALTLLTLDNTDDPNVIADVLDFRTGRWYDLDTPHGVEDDHEAIYKIYYTIGTPDDGHTLRPAVRLRAVEPSPLPPAAPAGTLYTSDEVTYPADIGLYEPGFEFIENVTPPEGGTAYSGQRLLAQTIRLEDRDEDDDDVTIHPIVVKNLGSASGNPDITKIEVWRRDAEEGDPLKLGETEDLTGLRTGGARVDLTHDNIVQDASGGAVTWLDIYLLIAEPEDMIAGRTIQLETRVLHTEKAASFDKLAVSNQWTLEINHRPVPDFTYELANNAPASIGPMADFTYEDTIQFTGEATDSDGDEIVAWHWDFGDGNTSDEQNPTHRYPNGGTFEVTLTVTDERGITGSVTKTIEVEGPPNEPPTIEEITADPENPAEDQDVQFGAVVSDPDQPAATAFTYAWDFGDETTSATAAPVHSYAEDGSYTVTLTVTDAQDGTDTATIEIIVGNDPPTLTGVTANPTDAQTGDDVTFTAQGAADPDGDDIVEYRWDFGDGTTATTSGNTATHVYAVAGTYTASVRAVDEREAVSDPETVEVTAEGPTQLITYAYPNPASTSATVSYLLPEDAVDPVLRIYSVSGLLIREEELAAGETTYAWDLNDDRGNQMPNGLYFCIVTAEDGDGGALSSEIFRLLIVR